MSRPKSALFKGAASAVDERPASSVKMSGRFLFIIFVPCVPFPPIRRSAASSNSFLVDGETIFVESSALMKTKVNYIPAGYHTATPYLIVNGAERALDFYKQAFGATEVMRMAGPDGKIMHAEFQ